MEYCSVGARRSGWVKEEADGVHGETKRVTGRHLSKKLPSAPLLALLCTTGGLGAPVEYFVFTR
jgi:hypothetical protein